MGLVFDSSALIAAERENRLVSERLASLATTLFQLNFHDTLAVESKARC